ncbi:hypothetical protein EVAR_9009_1 [Eumeta japonica]|uniref:Uncharacterized protein n=1 Tax=Eumeta variegata TaxID=151549 RepID=A0A4C1WRP7_EUMVA|nr:hypothetical protein EVAR_9009_1 [Eumeta japonica]
MPAQRLLSPRRARAYPAAIYRPLGIIQNHAMVNWLQQVNGPVRLVQNHTLIEYRRQVTVSVVGFLPVSENSDNPLHYPTNSLHQPISSFALMIPPELLRFQTQYLARSHSQYSPDVVLDADPGPALVFALRFAFS